MIFIIKEKKDMKKVMLTVLTVMMAAVMMIGCAAPAAALAKVYDEDDNTIFAKPGEEFTIKLDENPTTGYQWSYAITDGKIVSLSKDEFVTDEADKNVDGAGGQRVLTFKANAAGNTTINMVYERSWEKNEDDEKLSFEIEVK